MTSSLHPIQRSWRVPAVVSSLALLLTFAVVNGAHCAVSVADSPESFDRLIAATQPGDEIVIADGHHADWILEVPAVVHGAEGRPITIRASERGRAVFGGTSRIIVRGNYITLADLTFEGTGAPTLDIVGSHNRLTRSVFDGAGDRRKPHAAIVRIGELASDNEVDHCRFADSQSVSLQLRVPAQDGDGLPLRNHIHHNEFRDIRRYSENGQEPIQIGQGRGDGHSLATLVEYNAFVRADGDDELISVKSSGNTIRHNIATDSEGGISLRGGNDNRVDGNVLLRTKRGIVVTGDGHMLANNFIDQPRHEGILVAIGSKRYKAVTRSIIAHNTVFRAGAPLHFALRDPEATALPADNQIVNNILVARRNRNAIVSANGSATLDDYLATNEIRRNLLWWEDGGGREQISERLYEMNIVADPLLDLSDPLIPALRAGSPARHRALPGPGAGDGRADLAAPDIGAFQSDAP